MKGFLKIAGKVTDWNVYKKALIICDVTEMFINKYLPRNSRTVDQMRQAARSCKQNIVEGVADNTVSTEMCIKLLGVAKGSLRELGEDYYDFLRQQGYSAWGINDPRAMQARQYCRTHDDVVEFMEKCRQRSAETVANIMRTQIFQLDAMLAKVMRKYEAAFLAEGGIKENMLRARLEQRSKGGLDL